MANISYQHNKKTGAIYAYSVESYWDKDKKAPRTKQLYLGVLDQETGEIIPAKRRKPRREERAQSNTGPDVRPAKAQIVGPSLVLDEIARDTGLALILKRCFPQSYQQILSLVYFIVQKGLPLSRSEIWSRNNRHPAGDPFSSQRVSELLLQISEGERQKFLSLWLGRMMERDYLCYDITSISSYAQANEYVRYGYNRDGEHLPQVNLAMLFGQKSGLPAYYRRMPGKIPDVATLRTTIKSLDFLEASGMHFILDRGLYSQSNVDEMLSRRHHFTMAVPCGRKWVEDIMDQHYGKIASPANYLAISDQEVLYAVSHLYSWGAERRRTYLHLYYNARQAADNFDSFTRKLLQYKEEIESGGRVEANEEAYRRYLIVIQTPKRGLRVSFNEEAVEKHRKRYAGFFCIFSSRIKDSLTALRVYRAKEAVENSFDDLKNQLDVKRLRVHSSAAMDSRLFLQFIALIFLCRLRNVIAADKDLKNLTAREIMESMESMVKITYPGRYGQLCTESYPIQRKIMTAFNITPPA
jgi:hypothetical protein